MATMQSITERAFRLATSVGTDANASPVIDEIFLTEDLFPEALRLAVIEQKFKRDYALTLADGKVTLPSGVILSEMPGANIYAEDAESPTSIEQRFFDFTRAPHDQLNYAVVSGNTLHFRDAGGEMNESDDTINLTTVALPDIPASLTDAIEMPETLADRTAEILAGLMRGE